MSESNARKRNLPSWMSSREEENDDGEKSKQPRKHGKSNKDQKAFHVESKVEENAASGSATSSGASDIAKLMEGVVFVLSGFVNPERGVLRSQMLEMGAEYQPDWNSSCTLLVCAFANTPKFRQVKADGGTVISKDWISECYSQRKLIDIETYLLHAGKPWRKQSISHEAREDIKPATSSRSIKQEEKVQPKKTTGSSKTKGCFSPAKVKKWAVEDLKRTISWLENQDEKPEPSEIKKIASEGILTCLQDAIDALKQGQGIQQITEQWACLPRVVEQLAQFDGNKDGTALPSRDDLCREAMVCKQIYELEFLNLEHDDFVDRKRPQTHKSKKVGNMRDYVAGDDTSYDSDATVEMTEEEIDQAYSTIACSL
ncbi:DNA-repair protein XRCC1 [Sesamum alatum]|uniref:DNA-repair protein XRCC1 n=1 Tax=Sesamum alatum TaxID=300844 RepID=A0AAE1YDI8_9LAMI|nr:DNA-repair protein XRCC1 [Sesamum alatum]